MIENSQDRLRDAQEGFSIEEFSDGRSKKKEDSGLKVSQQSKLVAQSQGLVSSSSIGKNVLAIAHGLAFATFGHQLSNFVPNSKPAIVANRDSIEDTAIGLKKEIERKQTKSEDDLVIKAFKEDIKTNTLKNLKSVEESKIKSQPNAGGSGDCNFRSQKFTKIASKGKLQK